MGSGLIGEKTALLQRFLEETRSIGVQLSNETPEGLASVQEHIGERDVIIGRINEINAALARAEGPEDAGAKGQAAVWQRILEDIQRLENANEKKLRSMMDVSMEKARSTQDSIHIINTYLKQVTEEDISNVDKRK